MSEKELNQAIHSFKIIQFRYTRILLVSIAVLSVLPGMFLSYLPMPAQSLFSLTFLAIFIFSVFQSIADFFVQLSQILLRNRNNTFTEQYFPEVKEMANTLGLNYDKSIRVTNNPSITGPIVIDDMIAIPSSWLMKYKRSEILAAIGHELGHMKGRRRLILELVVIVVSPTAIFFFGLGYCSLIIGLPTNPFLSVVGTLTFAMVLLSYVMWRNEYRADLYAATGATPKPLLTILEAQKEATNRDEDSFIHPSIISTANRQVEAASEI